VHSAADQSSEEAGGRQRHHPFFKGLQEDL
jgi:hypothetical protein